MKMYHTICYISDARENLTDKEVQDLLDYTSSENNRCNVSGILLYSLGKFFQVLEGNKEYLEELFEKIKQDNRHDEIFEVYNKETAHPTFLHYNSQFTIVDDWESLEKIKFYLKENRDQSTSDKLNRLIQPFLLAGTLDLE